MHNRKFKSSLLSLLIATAATTMFTSTSFASRGSTSSQVFDGTTPYHLHWGKFIVNVNRIVKDPDDPLQNYQELRIVNARHSVVRTIREPYFIEVRVVSVPNAPNGVLWFGAASGGHNGGIYYGAYTQDGDLCNILMTYDTNFASPNLASKGEPFTIMVQTGLDGPFINIHDYPKVSLVYAWNGKRFSLATKNYPKATVAEAAKMQSSIKNANPSLSEMDLKVVEKNTLSYLADMTAADREAEATAWLNRNATMQVKDWLAANQDIVKENKKSIERTPQHLPIDNSKLVDDAGTL